jgi:hypothetical protein
MVRCPTCKTVFSAAVGLNPPEAEEELEDELDEPEEKPKPKRRRPGRVEEDEEDEEEKPRRRKPTTKDSKEEDKKTSENRDFDPGDPDEKPRKRRRAPEDDDEEAAEERAALKRAFMRAAWGAKLIWISLLLFMISMLMIVGFWFEAAFGIYSGFFLVLAGMVGLANWLVALVGIGLCLSGPPSSGHWGYGISAVVATAIHLILLLILVGQTGEGMDKRVIDSQGSLGAQKWAQIPTRLDTITVYLPAILFADQDLVPKSTILLSVFVGVAEMVRIILIMMLLSCLAQSAGDVELSYACTRAGGTASLSPGLLSVFMTLYIGILIEASAQGTFFRIIFMTVQMGIYAILCGTMMRAMSASRDVSEACEEPFQSQLVHL